MPFPWKKNKVTRISNFVADLHSPKRGGSLVVQTGFPTSLIDLFVKNRSRFKKPKLNPPVHRQIPDPPPRTAAPSSNSTNRMLPCAERRHSEAPISRRSVGDDGADQDLAGSGSDANKVIGALMKTLMVLVVTLSVKKLTFGITISAFVLLFIEYAGKRVVSWLKPCSNARVSCCKILRNLASATTTKNREALLETSESKKSGSSFVQEIVEIVETGDGCDCEEESESEVNRFNGEKKKEDSQTKTKTIRSGKFKSKIVMKLVPKKLRGSKKEKRVRAKKETESSQCSEVEEEEEEDNGMSKLECIEEEEDDEVDYGSTCSNAAHEEEERIESSIGRVEDSESKSESSIMLLLIALAGLIEDTKDNNGQIPLVVDVELFFYTLSHPLYENLM
ncbi:putative transmembrane protein [Senna tora]|uniref:Putative transmembrane protein n=1 Tax=Senna tora TaxID=362788 RepID=A0A834XDT9_9FABA|nr:putative transmembrane protein [Senna tora]